MLTLHILVTHFKNTRHSYEDVSYKEIPFTYFYGHLARWNKPSTSPGAGHPVDSVDNACHELKMCYQCANKESACSISMWTRNKSLDLLIYSFFFQDLENFTEISVLNKLRNFTQKCTDICWQSKHLLTIIYCFVI